MATMEPTRAPEWALLISGHRSRTRHVGQALVSKQAPSFSGLPRIEVVLVVGRAACSGIVSP